jgi:hypothetical protein
MGVGQQEGVRVTWAFLIALLQLVFAPAAAPAESTDGSVAAFMGPLPGTTYVYHSFWNGALTEGEEGLVTAIAKEAGSTLRLQVVTRLANGPSGGPLESKAEQILRVTDGALEAINVEGRKAVVLREPLKVGNTWARLTWSWRPTSPQQPSDGAGKRVGSNDGEWTAFPGTCRIERTFNATLFDKERMVVLVSCSVKTSEGIETTSAEEWASGLGMVRAIESAKDPSGRGLSVSERRLVRVRRSECDSVPTRATRSQGCRPHHRCP